MRRRIILATLVGGAVLGCGGRAAETRAGHPATDGAAGAQSGAAGSGLAGAAGDTAVTGGEAGISGAPSEPSVGVNCAYPSLASPSALGASLPGGSQVAALASDCPLTLSDPIPVSASGDFAFSYDVNGDQIGDLFFGDGPGLQLFLSQVVDGKLAFAPSDCAALAPIAAEFPESIFVHDLNGDGAPDLVLGTRDGLRAFLNLPTGFSRVLDYQWTDLPVGAWSGTLQVDVADVDSDGVQDILYGYDRNFGLGSQQLELGVAVFRAIKTGNLIRYEEPRTWVNRFEIGSNSTVVAPSGYFAVTPRSGATLPSLFLLQVNGLGMSALWSPSRLRFDVVSESSMLSSAEDLPTKVWPSPFEGAAGSVLLSRQNSVVIYDPQSPTALGASYNSVWDRPRYGHEWGGGSEILTRLLIDVDADGDRDLLEFDPSSDGSQTDVAIHTNLLGQQFAAPRLLHTTGPLPNFTETPFIAAGSAAAALWVTSAPAVQGLICATQ